ncbi:hypothetical protein OHA77_17455 [Streptosporangium sp. NBC_01639]|uniref:hypothetical protein n=1 Tax=Streptosporangium sp. NBC_01639 TaxID=2975948 RepID=UPI00386E63C3|nr:hypothetical protein OHA77_17455 [Streptosporangium sp. NBC_01639]
MSTSDPEERFTRLVRLGRDLRRLGVGTSLVLPPTGHPVLEIRLAGETRARITAVHRSRGWVFTGRSGRARPWRSGAWVWAEADNVADVIASAVTP